MASIDKRPNGKWRARWREYAGGPQRTKQFARKADAERFLTATEHSLMVGAYVPPEAANVTLAEYARAHVARQPWRSGTTDIATNALAHAVRGLGDRPLGSVRKSDVQAFVSGLDLAPSTVATVFQHLNALFAAAVDDVILARNPARGVKLPSSSAGEVVPPTIEEVAALADAAAPWFRPAVMLGAGLGLRQAEASGLTVDRVLWLERAVRIDRQWVSRRRPARFGPPKTAASDRTVPASTVVLDVLGEHVGRRHDGFVLHQLGEPVDSNAFGHQWRQARKRAGLESMRFHDLRHAFASMLIAAGCSVKAVQHALGHSNATTTLDLYGHLWPGDEDRIRAAVDSMLARPAEDSLRTDAPAQ